MKRKTATVNKYIWSTETGQRNVVATAVATVFDHDRQKRTFNNSIKFKQKHEYIE